MLNFDISWQQKIQNTFWKLEDGRKCNKQFIEVLSFNQIKRPHFHSKCNWNDATIIIVIVQQHCIKFWKLIGQMPRSWCKDTYPSVTLHCMWQQLCLQYNSSMQHKDLYQNNNNKWKFSHLTVFWFKDCLWLSRRYCQS